MKTVSVLLGDEDFEALQIEAQKASKNIADLLDEIVQDWLTQEKMKQKARKLLYDIGDGVGEGPEDLASNHDGYLYDQHE